MKKTVVLVLVILISSAVLFFLQQFTGFFIYRHIEDEWWNSSYNFRVKIEVDSRSYNRTDWPIEIPINLTEKLRELNLSEEIDMDSLRLVEYKNGKPIWLIPFQFDRDKNFNSRDNAAGELVFILNGSNKEKREFYLYFDIAKNGKKEKINFPTNLSYSVRGNQIFVNTTGFMFTLTNSSKKFGFTNIERKEEFGGLYVFYPTEEPFEYTITFNQTHSFFYIPEEISILKGPVRLKVEIRAKEIDNFGNPTGINYTKTYYFYNYAGPGSLNGIAANLIKIRQKFEGNAIRFSNSSPSIEISNLYGDPNENIGVVSERNNPFSYAYAFRGSFSVQIINLNYSGIEFFAGNENTNTIGIYFNEANINGAEQVSSLFVGILSIGEELEYPYKILDGYMYPLNITIHITENREVIVGSTTEKPVYNRGEVVKVLAYKISDPYNLVYNVTARIDRATLAENDDIILILYDDGIRDNGIPNDKIFGNSFYILPTDSVGEWKITIHVFDKASTLLIKNESSFFVTDKLNVITSVINKKGYVSRLLNVSVTVRNFRNDSFIRNATIRCFEEGIEKPINVTNFQNGSYLVSTLASSNPGYNIINCSAFYLNNSGFGVDIYDSTDVKTRLGIKINPENYISENITTYSSESFNLTVNISNLHIGYAYNVNISFIFLSNYFDVNPRNSSCNTIFIDDFCLRTFRVTIRNATPPGNYNIIVNVTWRNFDGTIGRNSTTLSINVKSNKILEIYPEKITSVNPPGKETFLGSIILNSTGNDFVYNISFSSNLTDFEFLFYPKVSQIRAGEVLKIDVNVSIPLGYRSGTYYGFLNVSSEIGFKEIEVIIKVSGTDAIIEVNPYEYISENITAFSDEIFEVLVNITNIGNVEAFFSNFSIAFPKNFSSNVTFLACGNLSSGASCLVSMKIKIDKLTPPGVYEILYYFNWTDIGIASRSIVNKTTIIVRSNKILEIFPNNFSIEISHNQTKLLGSIILNSTGNDFVYNISFSSNLTDFEFLFYPKVSQIRAGEVLKIDVNVSIPLGYRSGTYYGFLNVSSEIGFKEIEVIIRIPIDGRWYLDKESCEATFYPPFGSVCTIRIKNLGNMPLSFYISPKEANYTWIERDYIELEAQSSDFFEIFYDVRIAPLRFIHSYYNITSLQNYSNPPSRIVNITLKPFVGAIANISIIRNLTAQLSNITINASVFDRSGIGMDYVKAIIQKPDGNLENVSLTKVYEANRSSIWTANFSNTTLSGVYFVTLEMKDLANVTTYAYSNFLVYRIITPNIYTNKDEYERNDVASIYFTLTDIAGFGVDNASVRLYVLTPSGFKILDEKHITEDGKIPIVSLRIPSDAELGTYRIVANVSYFDPIKRDFSYSSYSKEILVTDRPKISLFADLETSVIWYPENIMRFSITFYDEKGNLFDPENAELKVFDPAENLYFSKNLSQFRKESEGFYTLKYAMHPNTPTGVYLAVLNFSRYNINSIKAKMFRVSAGGPFDLRVNILKKEVARGELLPFEITIINMGEVSMDVFIEYFVKDKEGNVYYYSSEWIYSAASSNKTILRNAYIFSNQPLGLHYLTVIMSYDPVKPPLSANETFNVVEKIEKPTVTPPKPYIPPAPQPPIQPKPEIKNYSIEFLYVPQEIRVVAGEERSFLIVVRNSGNQPLKNIEVKLLGIDESWYRIKPHTFKTFDVNQTLIFEVLLLIPTGIRQQEIKIAFYFKSFELITSREITLKIFRSMEEALLDELKEIKNRLLDLKSKTYEAKIENKNVTEVEKIILKAEDLIKIIESLIKSKEYTEATIKMYEVRSLIEKGFYLLEIAPKIVKIEWEKYFIIGGILSVVLLAVLSFVFYISAIRRTQKITYKAVESTVEELRKLKIEQKTSDKEIERIKKILEVLEREYIEGIISRETYEELRKKYEEKLKGS